MERDIHLEKPLPMSVKNAPVIQADGHAKIYPVQAHVQ